VEHERRNERHEAHGLHRCQGRTKNVHRSGQVKTSKRKYKKGLEKPIRSGKNSGNDSQKQQEKGGKKERKRGAELKLSEEKAAAVK